MAFYPDNHGIEDDPDSITLQELEPMTSSPYVRISLDVPPESAASVEREQRRRQREADRQREMERQKQQAAQKRKAAAQQRPRTPDPSLHVIIERAPDEASYDDARYGDVPYRRGYDSAPIPETNARTTPIASDRASSEARPRQSSASNERSASFPRIPDGMVYQVDEPEPSAPPSVVLPNGGWGAQRSRYPGMSSGRSSSTSYGYEGFRPHAVSSDIPMYFNSANGASDMGERRPKIEPLGASAAREASSGVIKRPWSESAFKDHASYAANAASASSAAPAQASAAAPTQPVPVSRPAPSTPTVTLNGLARATASPGVQGVDRGRVEQRPFNVTDDPYAAPRGMGSWKRNAAEAMRREQSGNPRTPGNGTVNIQMNPAPIGTSEAGNLHVSRESLNSMGVNLPPQRQSSMRTFSTPLIEENALKESVMFEEPPVSIADELKTADRRRKRRRNIIIGAIALIVVAACVIGALLYTGTITPETFMPSSSSRTSAGTPGGLSSGSTSNGGGTSSGTSRSSSASDQSGTVIYEYTATTSDGVAYQVNDTVTYDVEGKCQHTTMKLEFPDEATCADFLANLERDYGSAYQLDSQSGASATVTIDISSLKFDREEYEDALRYSVEELTVLKK